MIVVDASVVADALAEPTAAGEHARARIEQERDLHAPHLLDLEVTNTFRRRVRAGKLDAEQAAMAMEDLLLLRISRYPHGPMLPRIWELRENVTPYDASYVALAEQLECVFVTGDARLAKVHSVHCRIEVLR